MAYTAIDKPTDYFETITYTGNGSSLEVNGLDFSPDWVWIKKRSNAANHMVYDSVRGIKKHFHTNTNDSQVSEADNDIGLNSFDSDGFTVKVNGNTNTNNHTYASWNWKAETAFTNDASGTGIGSIDSAGSANDTAGFSIVTWTGTGSAGTIKHGLSSAPKMIIVRPIASDGVWLVHHKDIPIKGQVQLQSTAAIYEHSGTIYWGGTFPTSSVFSIGTSGSVNADGVTYIAYCFAEIKGYSKIGSYTGNGNADGSFIYTGFKPAFVILKRTDATNNWHLADNKRLNPYNPTSAQMYPNLANAEAEQADLDILSNGFKPRQAHAFMNASGGAYIYMAFAENPFVTSSGVPATAR